MKLIKIEEAHAGQKAARDITDLTGRILFKAGSEISADLIAQCRRRNVSYLFVSDDGPTPAAAPAAAPSRKEDIEEAVDQMFFGTDADPVMASLREAAKRYLTEEK